MKIKDKKLFDYLHFNSFLSPRYKLLYISTPKVACTSLKWWIAALEGYSGILSEGENSGESSPELVIHDTFYKVAPNVTGLPKNRLEELLRSNRFFRFAVVRNPYTRIFSAWQSKLLLREPLQAENYKNSNFFQFPIRSIEDIVPAFECFIEHLAALEAPNYWDVHWTPQTDLIRPDLISYNQVAQIENVQPLREALFDYLGSGIPDPFGTWKNESIIPYLPQFISNRAAELVQDLYRKDFETFGYEFKKPQTKESFSNDQFKIALKSIGLIRGRHQRLFKIRSETYSQICSLNQTITERDTQFHNMNQTADDRERQIKSLNQAITERDTQIHNMNKTADDHERQIKSLDQAITELYRKISSINDEREKLRFELDMMIGSNSWGITKPLRFLRRSLISRPYSLFRKYLSDCSRWCWYRLPISVKNKQKLKYFLFGNLFFFLRWTKAYRSWKKFIEPLGPTSNEETTQLQNPTLQCTSHKAEQIDEYVPLTDEKPLDQRPVKIICFYLPQFHPIPENNSWWGDGFTEWTNVKPALPQFVGHYQPRKPGELGYYNLLDPKVQKRQVELAKLYGLEGFCFYFYWFGGKRLLETPIENYLNNDSLDLNFCLCWANENWTRRWDGLDNEVLIAQKHSPEDDIAFIQHVSQYMQDKRYIRVDGKPLLVVYRPSLLPSARSTAKRWRQWCRNNQIGEIYLAYTQSFEAVDPIQYGFDAAIEFPPNNSSPPDITANFTPLAKDAEHTVYDYQVFVDRSKKDFNKAYKMFRGVCPSWDNTARRRNYATIFANSTPVLYKQWLINAIQETRRRFSNKDERLVFINAWNEWAEGAYLEPDDRYGYAWLQATRDALANTLNCQHRTVLLVTHDCHPHGAQMLILGIAKELKLMGFEVNILALKGGKLFSDFAEVGKVIDIKQAGKFTLGRFLQKLRSEGAIDVISSTVVSGSLTPILSSYGFRILCLIHELPGVIQQMNQESNAELVSRYADKVVFPADMVYQRFNEIAPLPEEKVVIRAQGLLRRNPYRNRKAEAHKIICAKHNLPSDTQIVLSIAYIDYRKGPDIFVEMAALVLKQLPKTVFIWIGHAEAEMKKTVNAYIKELGLQEKVLFIGFDPDPLVYYAASSVYALTSREDPYPNVVLESAEVEVPVVAFEGASGATDFILEQGGRVAKSIDKYDFARNIIELLENPFIKPVNRVGSLRQYVLDLLYHLNGLPRISAIVPNYNYGQYIIERLESIFCQSYPIYEVIILDDGSSDNSLETIKEYLNCTENTATVIANKKNSGSVFKQWAKGISHSKGDLVWIAEADDLAYCNLIEKLSGAFIDKTVVLAYSQSKQIDKHGKVLSANYLGYTEDISNDWQNNYMHNGDEEISKALCVKNTIPNVSAVLFRKNILKEVLSNLGNKLYKYSIAGDWIVYLHVLKRGKIYFCKKSLNLHRRHSTSVTTQNNVINHIEEVQKAQAEAKELSCPSPGTLTMAEEYIRYLHRYFRISKN